MKRSQHLPSVLGLLALAATLAPVSSSPALAAASPPPPAAVASSDAANGLPAGWSLEPADGGVVLVWSGSPVPMGGARPEFRLGDDVLGRPREVAGELRLLLPTEQLVPVLAAPDRLAVWSAGRRLDEPTPGRSAGPTGFDSPPPVSRAVTTDPAARGRYGTQRWTYDLAPLVIDEYPAPVEVLAEVTMPVGAPGKRPLVLILHGRHVTCYRGGSGGEASGDWPCLPGWSPVPSHLGYRYLTDVLASQGYLAVSISANGINGQDWASADGGAAARSQLIRHHLDLWARWAQFSEDPWGGIVRGHVDMSKVVLVGHSRGGEGVNRAAIDAPDRAAYRIRGLVTYGPTAFGRQVTPDITSATILPACDGDVSDLQGQAYVDGSRDLAASPALRSAVLALGANHNFFNTEWTPGLSQAPSFDDWWDPADPVCGDGGSLRLTPLQQQAVGAAYTLALVRLAVNGEPAMLQLLDGTKIKPRSIGRAEVSTSPVGGDSLVLYRPEDVGTPTLLLGMNGGECSGYVPEGTTPGSPACGDGYPPESTPHWQPLYAVGSRPAPMAMALQWYSSPGSPRWWPTGPRPTARFTVGATPNGVDLSRYTTLDVRVANDPTLAPTALAVRVTDVRGRSAVLTADLAAIDGWPGTGMLDRIEARTLRGTLASARGVDLHKVRTVELVAAGPVGHVWVLDVRATRAQVTSPTDLNLPRVSAGVVVAPEGGAGEVSTVSVPILVEGTVARAATIWVQVRGSDASGNEVFAGYPLTIPKGASGVVAEVPLSYTGDDIYEPSYPGEGSQLNAGLVTLAAVSGAVTSRYIGGVTTVEDDPAPLLSGDPADVTGVEGDSLMWNLHLSGPSAGQFYTFTAEPPAGGAAELDTDDVDQDWLQDAIRNMNVDLTLPIDPPMPLSEIGRATTGHGLRFYVSFGSLVTDTSVEVPLRVDRRAEGDEQVAFDVLPEGNDPTIPVGGLRLIGRVAANSATDGLPQWADDAVVVDGTFGDSAGEETAIDAIVGDAHVVLAGSMSRGAAAGETARTGLVTDLVERHGVTDVLIDEPVATSVAAARYVAFGEGAADDAASAFADELNRTVEAAAFLEALRAYNATAAEPVFLVGIGAGSDPSALVDVVANWDPVAASLLACFDLDADGVATWFERPDGERETCRASLVAVRDGLAAKAVVAPRNEAGLDLVLAHAAAAALVGAEWSASVDPSAPGAADERASRDAESLAAGVTATRTREPAGRLVAALDDLDAGVLRNTPEPVAVPGAPDGSTQPTITTVTVRASVGALLVDSLGDADVATIGVSAGTGEVRSYSVWDMRYLERQPLDRPFRGSVERSLSTYGPDGSAFVLALAGQTEFDGALPMRIGIRDEYLAWEAASWYLPVTLTSSFDGIVHVRRTAATSLLSQRPRLEIDGTPVALGPPCSSPIDGTVVATFPNGELRMQVRWDEPTGSMVAMVTVVLDGVTYDGVLPASDSWGWTFTGLLSAPGGASITVTGYVPFDLPSC